MEAADGLLEGDWVRVTYRGAISGTDTTGVHVDRVEFNGVTGYAASQYLTNVRPGLGATEEQETNETVTTTANLRLHETTDVDSPVVAVVPAGTALHRVAYTADGWSIVLYNGETVYCATEYVTQ